MLMADRPAWAGNRGCVVGAPGRRGFTLLELLASIAIIALLISILLPSMSRMKESARRVICASAVHQQGAALAMWADVRGRDLIPPTFAGHGAYDGVSKPDNDNFDLAETMCVRRLTLNNGGAWDGLGKLYEYDFIDSAEGYYCPSHTGDHPYERYQTVWPNPGDQLIYSNYQYRGIPWEYQTHKFSQLGADVTLITDGMRTASDFNHVDGCNLLKADLSVRWYEDSGEHVLGTLLSLEDPPDHETQVQLFQALWLFLDNNGSDTGGNTGDFNDDYLGGMMGNSHY